MNRTSTTRHGVAAVSAAVSLIAGSALIAPSAQADQNYAISWTVKGIYARSSPEMLTTNRVGAALRDGSVITIACETTGAPVTSSVATSTLWARTTSGTYLPNAFIDTGVNGPTPGVPSCEASTTTAPSWTEAQIAAVDGYTPRSAQEWARANYDSFPVAYGSNCTWFVSHALWAGGLAKTREWTDSSFSVWKLASKKKIPGPTKAATTADYLKNELIDSEVGTLEKIDLATAAVPNAKIGDLIFYDWDPNGEADGQVDHVVMITGFVAGAPVVTGQTNNVLDQRWQYTSTQKLITSTKKSVNAYLMQIEH